MKKFLLFVFLFPIAFCFAEEEVVLEVDTPEMFQINTGNIHYENRKMERDTTDEVDMSLGEIRSIFLEDVLSEEKAFNKNKKDKKKSKR